MCTMLSNFLLNLQRAQYSWNSAHSQPNCCFQDGRFAFVSSHKHLNLPPICTTGMLHICNSHHRKEGLETSIVISWTKRMFSFASRRVFFQYFCLSDSRIIQKLLGQETKNPQNIIGAKRNGFDEMKQDFVLEANT